MKLLLRLMVCSAVLFFATTLRAQDDDKPKDAEGCKDSPLVTRFPGSIISIRAITRSLMKRSCPSSRNKNGERASQRHVEGEVHSWDLRYSGRHERDLQLFRNFRDRSEASRFHH